MLETHNLSKRYKDKVALDGLSMHVKPSTLYGFLGINGAGKTTTLSILGGAVYPTSGTFTVGGRLAILPQDARFYSGRKVLDQLQFLARLSGVSRAGAEKEALRVLGLVELLDQKNVAADTLSHGMYKRLGIAQALLGEPDILLLDEPTAGLDPQTAYATRQLIKGLAKEKTVVMSSHNLHEIAEMCDEVGVIHQGKMRFEGKTSELTQKGSSLEIHVSKGLDITLFKDLPGLASHHFDEELFIINLSFHHVGISMEDLNEKIINLVLGQGIGIRQIIQGKSLEKGFLELLQGMEKDRKD